MAETKAELQNYRKTLENKATNKQRVFWLAN